MADLLGGIGVFWVLFLGALGILWFLCMRITLPRRFVGCILFNVCNPFWT